MRLTKGKAEKRANRLFQEDLRRMLLALVRANRDRIRPEIRTQGIDERDLAFEADLLIPAEVEPQIYGSQKRGRVLRLIGAMKEQGWAQYQAIPPSGAYRVFLQAEGERYAAELLQPWWFKLWERLRGGPSGQSSANSR